MTTQPMTIDHPTRSIPATTSDAASQAPRRIGRTRTLVLASMIGLGAIFAPTGVAEGTTRNIADGRTVQTGGDWCDNYWYSSYRQFTAGRIVISGFKSQFYNRVRVTPRVQYSINNGASWIEWFKLQTVELTTQGYHGAMGVPGWGPVKVGPLPTQRYVARTVYRISWARTDVNGNVLGWTTPIVMAENQSTTRIHYAGGVRYVDGCVILSANNN